MFENSDINQLIDHLFRHEYGKMIAFMTRVFGPDQLELAEDVVQDSLVEAITQWSYKGIPENPSAWLVKVAKNKALNILNRDKYRHAYTDALKHLLPPGFTEMPDEDIPMPDEVLLDDQLKMMFTCCHPSISSDSQVALILKTLCGFSIAEIAKGFLTSEENINKRLVRARQKLREHKVAFEVPRPHEVEERLAIILRSIYLLFNEGYSASQGNDLIRFELCEEAMRLTGLIIAYPGVDHKSDVHALMALMALNASRFKARQGSEGNILTLAEQDRSAWDQSLILSGLNQLEKSTDDGHVSIYHFLAGISACHCTAPDFQSTDWKSIVSLYDDILELDPSPIVFLNRAIAISKLHGASAGLKELEAIESTPSLQDYHLLFSTKAELLAELNRYPEAITNIEKALVMASLEVEKELMQKRLNTYRKKILV